MIVQKSLHNRYNRNNARKCFQNTSTAKILCTDASRSIRKANDWTFACLVNYSGVNDLASLYSDYDATKGIAIALDALTSGTETYVRIIDILLRWLPGVSGDGRKSRNTPSHRTPRHRRNSQSSSCRLPPACQG